MDPIRQDATLLLDRLLSGARQVSVVGHTHPDGDALGSVGAMTAYLAEKRGLTVRGIFPDTPPETLRFLCREDFLYADAQREVSLRFIGGSDLVILQDCNNFTRTEALAESLRASLATKILIDHHLNPDRDAFRLVFSTPDVSSASELLYWILLDLPDVTGDARNLPADCLASLMAGMTTDTNNFANSVFPSTLRMAGGLLAAGVDRDGILDQLYHNYRENRVRGMGYFQNEGLHITGQGVAYMIATRSVIERFDLREGETEGLVNVPLSIGKVRLSLFLKEDKGYFRVSIRSKRGTSAQQLAVRYFHGGGHENASGGRLFFPEDIPSPEEAAAYIEQVSSAFLNE